MIRNDPKGLRACLLASLFVCGSPLLAAGAAKGDGSEAKGEENVLVYIGTYTRGESEGIYAYRLDAGTGELTSIGLAAETVNPSFLAIHPNGRFLYAVGEVAMFHGKESGAVSALAIDRESGKLEVLNKQPTGGGGPCHLIVDHAGKNVLVANYGGGSVCAVPIEEDGRLGEMSAFVQHEGSSVDPRRQQGPHAHSINLDPAGRFAFAADLGLDKVLIYRFDPEKGTLTENDPAFATVPPGSGPRHFDFHPDGRHAYVINEMASTVTAFDYDPQRGALDALQTITTLPEGFEETSHTAEVQVHPSGRFLYGSNRGHDSIAVFSIDERTGRLTPVGHHSTRGKTPRNFGIDPSGRYLLAANQNTDNVVVFRIDSETGALTPTGQEVEVPTPVCVKFLPVD